MRNIAEKMNPADLPLVFQLKHTRDRILLLDFTHCALVLSLAHLDGMRRFLTCREVGGYYMPFADEYVVSAHPPLPQHPKVPRPWVLNMYSMVTTMYNT